MIKQVEVEVLLLNEVRRFGITNFQSDKNIGVFGCLGFHPFNCVIVNKDFGSYLNDKAVNNLNDHSVILRKIRTSFFKFGNNIIKKNTSSIDNQHYKNISLFSIGMMSFYFNTFNINKFKSNDLHSLPDVNVYQRVCKYLNKYVIFNVESTFEAVVVNNTDSNCDEKYKKQLLSYVYFCLCQSYWLIKNNTKCQYYSTLFQLINQKNLALRTLCCQHLKDDDETYSDDIQRVYKLKALLKSMTMLDIKNNDNNKMPHNVEKQMDKLVYFCENVLLDKNGENEHLYLQWKNATMLKNIECNVCHINCNDSNKQFKKCKRCKKQFIVQDNVKKLIGMQIIIKMFAFCKPLSFFAKFILFNVLIKLNFRLLSFT